MEIEIFKMNLIVSMILVLKHNRLSNLCPIFSGDHPATGQNYRNLMKSLFHVSEGKITKLIREGLFIELTRVVGGHLPPELPDDAAACLRLGGGGQPHVGGGGGQQLIPLQVDVLDEDVEGGHHQEGGHRGHQTFQHVRDLLLCGSEGELSDLTDERDDEGHHLELGEAETSFPGPGRDPGEGGQKSSHLDVVISTDEGKERWRNINFHEHRKQQEVDSLDR